MRRIVDYLTHEQNEIPIFFDSATEEFSVEVAGKTFTAEHFRVLKEKIVDALAAEQHYGKLTPQPVIAVTVPNLRHHQEQWQGENDEPPERYSSFMFVPSITAEALLVIWSEHGHHLNAGSYARWLEEGECMMAAGAYRSLADVDLLPPGAEIPAGPIDYVVITGDVNDLDDRTVILMAYTPERARRLRKLFRERIVQSADTAALIEYITK